MSTFENTQDSSDTRRRIRVPDAIQTTNATQTTAFSIDVPVNTGFFIQVRALVLRSDFSSAQAMVQEGCFRRAAGNVLRASGNGGVLKPITRIVGDFATVLGQAPELDLVANTTNQTIDIKVSGQAGVTLNWYFDILTLRNTV